MSSVTGNVSAEYDDYSDAIIGHWKLNDITNGASLEYAPDSGPNNFNINARTTLSAGIQGTSGRATFNGSSDSFADTLNCYTALQFGKDKDPTHTAADALPSLIFSFFCNTTESAAASTIVSSRGLGANTEGVSIILASGASAGKLGLTWDGNAGAGITQSSATLINDGVDHHCVVIVDRTNNRQEMYFDGTIDATQAKAISAQILEYADVAAAGNPEFNIGSYLNSNYWDGDLWNLQVYSTYRDITTLKTRQQLVDQLGTGGYLTKSFL